jgi:hypothetical protein
LDGRVEGAPWRVTFVVTTVVIIGAIFVPTHGMTAPRTAAVVTDEAIAPISTAGKRWDTMTPSVWSNKNKNKNKINKSGSNVTASMPADSYARAATAVAFA